MDIEFCLTWAEANRPINKAFKERSAFDIFSGYINRISKFMPCRAGGNLKSKEKGTQLWLCDSSGKALNSEELARRFEQLLGSGAKKVHILIGGPSGFPEQEVKKLNPDFKWSFGPATLAHELAAIVASEQIYRALTIIHKMPYHLGH